MTTVYKRTNHSRLDDHGVPLAMRASSYDGPAYLSEETLVADETKRQLTSLCNDIVEHFYDTEKKRITRLNLFFKTDDNNRMWLLWCSSIRVGADSLHPSTLEVPVRLDMRTEIINDGATSLEKMKLRRRRQKNLLALDYELFEVSRDLEFSLSVNASHKRQAKALGLKGLPELMMGDDPKDPRCNARHPLHPAFMTVCEPEDAIVNADSIGRSPETLVCEEDDEVSDGLYQATPEERVKAELVALAMDAWYEVYSTTLSDHPEVMPTTKVELASPLLEILDEEELQQLAELLGIQEASDREEAPLPAAANTRLYVAVPYLVSPGRRLDRPSSQVEADIKSFFDDLFHTRGIAILRACLEKHSLYFS
ncbi:hypothetical protein AGDE_06668 [Angomonas deanei]|nr:hypothetical protein AGDE_12014 [Angomonas deanei]EPY36936.1 hypothetical protein AGDE_06668 [Angomonas deanei]|eukprot:EPY25112.1 hypothetical protein AGDE_12014 [Angomonas deanei]